MYEIAIDLSIPIKLFIAILCGYVIGLERSRNGKHGGRRTFSLVCMASCIISIMSLELINIVTDNIVLNLSRLASYAIAGIGFLGSGTIIHRKNNVQGLTTAATLFLIVPIGLCIGFGFYFIGIIASIFTYLVLISKKYYVDEEEK